MNRKKDDELKELEKNKISPSVKKIEFLFRDRQEKIRCNRKRNEQSRLASSLQRSP